MAANLLRRVENLETLTAARDGSGGGWDPLTVEVEIGDGDDEETLIDEAVEAARLEREAQGRPILPLPGGIHTIVVCKTKGELR